MDRGASGDELKALAERIEAAAGPDRELDFAIWRGLGNGTCWPVCVPCYTASFDAAMSLAEPFMLVALSDIAADGLTGCCLCSDTSTSPPKEHWGIPSERGGTRQSLLARAVTAAALRALQESNK